MVTKKLKVYLGKTLLSPTPHNNLPSNTISTFNYIFETTPVIRNQNNTLELGYYTETNYPNDLYITLTFE